MASENKKKKGKKYVSQFDSGHHAVYFGAPGTGKAQPLYSKVLTPAGFVEMGTIETGDKVISGTNNIATVLGVYPQGKKPIYEITLEDGSTCRCCDEHIWHVSLNHELPQNLTLREILTRNIETNIRIPKFEEAQQKWYHLLINIWKAKDTEHLNFLFIIQAGSLII